MNQYDKLIKGIQIWFDHITSSAEAKVSVGGGGITTIYSLAIVKAEMIDTALNALIGTVVTFVAAWILTEVKVSLKAWWKKRKK